MKRRAPIHSGTVHCSNYVFLSRYGIFSEHDCDVKTHLFLCRTEEFRQPHFSQEVSTFVQVLNPCPYITETSLTDELKLLFITCKQTSCVSVFANVLPVQTDNKFDHRNSRNFCICNLNMALLSGILAI